ncbi:MAG: hypothetical protein KDB29_04175 [Planctomycetes bacterium]|nr:hypothetical protein [Planctomycetota bacterium]
MALLSLCATALHAQKTDSEILRAMDDATASEARWVLTANFGATGAIGFFGEYTRAGLAYRRLLRLGEETNFWQLAESNNDVCVYFAIQGLAKLAPARLPGLLSQLVLRRGKFERGSGCIVSTTCIAREVLDAVLKLKPERKLVIEALQRFASGLDEAGGSWADAAIVRNFKEWLGDLPVMQPAPKSWPYIVALQDKSTTPALRKLITAGAEATAGRLALDFLACGETPNTETDLLTQVSSHKLESEDAIVDLQIHTHYWLRCEKALSTLLSDSKARVTLADCPWHSVTVNDWKWLLKHEDQRVRQSAASLQSNLITGWRLEPDLEGDPIKRKIWLLFCLQHALGGDELATAQLESMKKDIPELLPAANIELEEQGCLAGRALVRLLDNETLAEVMMQAVQNTDCTNPLPALRVLAVISRDEDGNSRLFDWPGGIRATMKRLWELCGDAGRDDIWELRVLTQTISQDLNDEEIKTAAAYDLAWITELARAMVSNPRKTPEELRYYGYSTVDVFDIVDGRAVELLGSIYSGSEEFLPDTEVPARPKEEASPSVQEIYRRMQFALTKLNS